MKRPFVGIALALAAAGVLALSVGMRWGGSSKPGGLTVELRLKGFTFCRPDPEVPETGKQCQRIDYSDSALLEDVPGWLPRAGSAVYYGALGSAVLLAIAALLATMGQTIGRLITPPRIALAVTGATLAAEAAFFYLAGFPGGGDRGALYGVGGAVAGIVAAAMLSHWHQYGAMSSGVTGARADIERWDEGRGRAKPDRGRSVLDQDMGVGAAPEQLGAGHAGDCPTCGSRTHQMDGRAYCDLCQKFV